MVPIKRLYVVAGFEGADHESTVAAVQRMFPGNDRRFLTRLYPSRPDRQTGYLPALVQRAVALVFGNQGATNFCRKQDQPCVLDDLRGRERNRTCERVKGEPVACARARPQMIIVICAERLFAEVFERLGRAVLIMRIAGPVLPDAAALKAAIDAFEPVATHVNEVVSQRAKSNYAPLVPDHNFQRIGANPIAADVQANPAQFGAIMRRHHQALYRGSFTNPKKSGVRGAYMMDEETAFQEDHLHRTVQIIGANSRRDGFHLLNAYHIYGVKTDPGFHFDVMNEAGAPIRRAFTDVLNGAAAGRTETHLNITPCDRLV